MLFVLLWFIKEHNDIYIIIRNQDPENKNADVGAFRKYIERP